MLSSKNRLRKQKDIRRVLANGRSWVVDCLRMKILRNDLAQTRFCFIVSSAVAAKAVDRNRMKRLMREAVHFLLPGVVSGFDVVIWLKNMPEGVDYLSILETAKKIFLACGLIILR